MRGLLIVLRVQVMGCTGFNTVALVRNSAFVYGPSSWTLNSSFQTICFEVGHFGHFDIGRFDIAVYEYCS